MKQVIAIIERGSDGSYGIYTPTLHNVIIGVGDTLAKAKEDFMIGYKDMIETYQADKEPIPAELEDVEFVYQYAHSSETKTTL